MAQESENLDFSGLFKLDVLVHLDIVSYSFSEVGLKKFIAFSSDRELVFIYIDSQAERFGHNHDWDFVDNPIYCMCFEPSGTWLLIVSEQKVLLVPYLPLFDSKSKFDLKWSLNSVSVLPLGTVPKPTSAAWWLTKESERILIIGCKNGSIIFYGLEAENIIGETKVPGEITELQICFDDSLDLLTLLISSSKTQQWKLILEHRSVGYNWLLQTSLQSTNRKEGFMNYIKQLSKDKISHFTQGGSKDDSKSVEYVLKPTEYLPQFRKGSNNWALTAQYVNGRHFLTAFELNEGTLILESLDEDIPSRTLRPRIKNGGQYLQGLWSQRLIYLMKNNKLEVHSSSFSVIQDENLLGGKREFSELWAAEVIGDSQRIYLMSAKEPPTLASGWREPTFLCDLQLPRFNLESCLLITSRGAYVLTTVCEPTEWLVSVIMRAGAGTEQLAAALGAPVPALLRAAADMLLSRGKIAAAHYLFSLSQTNLDGWVARLGVFGRLHELSMFKPTGSNVGSLGNTAITLKLLAILLKMGTNSEEKFDMDLQFTSLSMQELSELASITAAVGLFELLPLFTVHRGHPSLMLSAIKSRSGICRGALSCILNYRCLVPLMLEENAQWFFHFITGNCSKFDSAVLKNLCLWLNPLQDQLRPVMRDLKQGFTTLYSTRLLNLITTFIHVASEIESRDPCPDIHVEITQTPETWKNQFVPRRALSCGLAHWAVVDDGNAKIMMTNTSVDTELVGRVVDVACGRHHTLVLTENGIYSAGDNSYGQLGVGSVWAGAIGDSATPAGALMHVPYEWTAPLVAVSAGHYHSAAVDVGGRLFTWGWGVHGQLGLGSIDDHCTPQLVTKLQGRKVLSVGCGACHTTVLMKNGEVWAMGAGVFGQLGGGSREKSSVPIRVPLQDPVESIAVGYFHNLGVTGKGQVWSWGASPQQVRAAHGRRAASPASPASPANDPPSGDAHLLPQLVDITAVQGRIVQMAAGWHHSCIVNNAGTLYTWGLNFDGQLGSGDRKQIHTPTEVKIPNDSHSDSDKQCKTPEKEIHSMQSGALAACGGDFTVYIRDDGRVYATGNMHLPFVTNEREKGSRIIMMKTTKRVIKIPASIQAKGNKFLFQPIDRVDIMFPFDIEGSERRPIDPRLNPLNILQDFSKKTWADDIILLLKTWINEENLSANLNMAAKLAYHNKSYSECMRLLLDNLKTEPREEKLYLSHTEVGDDEMINKIRTISKKDERQIVVTSIMSKRIKDVSLSILNEDPYPVVDSGFYQSLSCGCDELKYLSESIPKSVVNVTEQNLSIKAAQLIDKCISMFPVEAELWETCFRLSKNFYLDNDLSVAELETVLRKYMETNATTMAAAIMYSNDCTQYSQILSPKFYLNMCSQVLDTWG